MKQRTPVIAHHAAWLLPADLIGKIANFVLLAVVARAIGERDFGFFSFSFSLIPVFLILADWGMDAFLVREIARERSRVAELFGSAMVLILGLGVVALSACFAVGFFLLDGDRAFLSLTLIGLALFLDQMATIVASVFRAFEAMRRAALIIVANRLLSTFAAVVVVAEGGGLVSVCVAYAGGSAGALVIGCVALRRAFPAASPRAATAAAITHLFRSGAALGAAGFLNMAVYRIDAVILLAVRGPVEVAIYGVAYRFFESFVTLSWALGNAALPVLSRAHDRVEGTRAFETTATLLLAAYVPIVAVMPFVGTWIVVTLFSDRYVKSGPLMPILAAGALLYAVGHLGRIAAIAAGKRTNVLRIAATLLVVNVSLNAYGIPRWGYVAAAWSTAGTELVGALLLMLLFLRTYGAPSLRKMTSVTIPACLALVTLLAAFDLRGGRAAIASVVIYPVLLVGLSAFLAPARLRGLRGAL